MQHENDNQLIIVLPELSVSQQTTAQHFHSSLDLILARASQRPLEHGYMTSVMALFGDVSVNASAALSLAAKGIDLDNKFVCFAEPTNMQPTREHVSIAQADFSDLTEAEAEGLLAELNHYFEEDGLRFYALQNDVWVCVMETSIPLPDVSAKQIVNQNILQYIPQANTAFKKLLSDGQMMLHHTHTNKLRSEAGKMEVNSLWFSQGGQLPKQVNTSLAKVWTDSPEIITLTQLAGVEIGELDELANIDNELIGKQALIFFKEADNVDALGEDFYMALFTAVKRKALSQLVIIIDDKTQFTLDHKASKRFWKRKFKG